MSPARGLIALNALACISIPAGLAIAALSLPGVTGDSERRRTQPRVAVIVPCFNDGRLVGEAVNSVDEGEPIELLVIDDGSDDPVTLETLDRLEAEGVRLIRQANQGVSAARMKGVAATTAPYVFPLDADDLAVPGMLKLMADRLDSEPGLDACFGDYLEFGQRELVRAVPEQFDPFRLIYTNEYPVSSLVRRTTLTQVGGWELRDGYEDWDLWMSLAERGARAEHLGAGIVTYGHRVHAGRRRMALWANHRDLYRTLRDRHPGLFGRVSDHRRASSMTATRKLLYPIIYGGRPRWSGEPRVKALLDRMGVWTLRR